MGKHAILSPSSAGRWLVCTPSARLEEQFKDTDSEAAKEGTLAHKLAEIMLSEALRFISVKEALAEYNAIAENGFYNETMHELCSAYKDYALEQFAAAQKHTIDAQIFLETEIDLTDIIPEGFGTIDVQIIADHILDIIDLKYGKGVPVSAEGNKQMMLYALGALKRWEMLYDINEVRMTIYQPRIDNITTAIIEADALRSWGEFVLKPLAEKAFAGEGEFVPGDYCRFCRAKPTCKAHAQMHMQLATSEFLDPALIDDDAVSDILGRADVVKNWLSSVEAYALDQAVNHGKRWPGFKLVEGRSNRVYLDEKKIAAAVKKLGHSNDEIYTKKLIGIGAMEKLLGKGVFAEKLNGLVAKPSGKPTLVFETDKRPELDSSAAAAKDFAEITQ
jgi:hypothetical protein